MPRQSQSSKNYMSIELVKKDIYVMQGDLTELKQDQKELKQDQKEGFEMILKEIKEVKSDLEEKYARRIDVDNNTKSISWMSKTFVGSIITIITSLIVWFITQ